MLAVEFEGEAGIGNGVRREWFQVACDNTCLSSTPNTLPFVDKGLSVDQKCGVRRSRCYWPTS